jgi:hypothetical protein
MKNEFKPPKSIARYDNSYPSVTQILGVLRKPGLEMWFKNNTAEFCTAESARGIKVGRIIHGLIQDYIDGKEPTITEMSDEIQNAVKSFSMFKKAYADIQLHRAELKLTSNVHNYNGTLDAIATHNGNICIVDWKTGKVGDKETPPIYDEYITQVSAYCEAYSEVYGVKIKNAYIFVFAKDKPAFEVMELGEQDLDFHFNYIFLPALTIFNAQKQLKQKEKRQ